MCARITLISILVLTALGLISACRSRQEPRVELPAVDATQIQPNQITVDGRLVEEAWSSAARTEAFVRPNDGGHDSTSPVAGEARIVWDNDALYIGLVVNDQNPTSPFSRDDVDPHIWAEASGIEVMLQPGDPGDNTHYYEVQVDVAEAVWDTRFDDYNQPVIGSGDERRYGHQDWDAQLERAVSVGGDHYTVELALPWSTLENPHSSLPPSAGDIWRMNLYTFRDGQSHSMAWSAILGEGNFHRSSRFGHLRFVVE